MVRYLVQTGNNKDCKDQDENTPLHYASEYGHVEVIKFLVKEALADPSLKNKFGYIPMDIAQNIQVIQIFEQILGLEGRRESLY